jgi:hypothetical protein
MKSSSPSIGPTGETNRRAELDSNYSFRSSQYSIRFFAIRRASGLILLRSAARAQGFHFTVSRSVHNLTQFLLSFHYPEFFLSFSSYIILFK